jgi:two-component system phosphate regulon sensor histidine kinase PhoR
MAGCVSVARAGARGCRYTIRGVMMRRLSQPVRVAGTYLLAALLWILVSDQAVAMLIPDPGWATVASTVKGWGFVAVTTALLYAVLERDRREVATQAAAASEAEQRFRRIIETVPDAILLLDAEGGLHERRRRAAPRLAMGAGGDGTRGHR